MNVQQTNLPGVLIIEPEIFPDHRGFFLESYHASRYQKLGLPNNFVQDNHSLSCRNTIRGLHAQIQKPQAKLIRVVEGEIFDVAVDIRLGSPTFSQWTAVVLSEVNKLQLYIPAGFAHGFAVTSCSAQVEYKCTEYYDSKNQVNILWSDTAIGINWPIDAPILSDKDSCAPVLKEIQDKLTHF